MWRVTYSSIDGNGWEIEEKDDWETINFNLNFLSHHFSQRFTKEIKIALLPICEHAVT